jgi:hypothetical protein
VAKVPVKARFKQAADRFGIFLTQNQAPKTFGAGLFSYGGIRNDKSHTNDFDARTKVLFNCGDSAKGRAEDCGELASAGARYPGGVSGFTAVGQRHSSFAVVDLVQARD